MVLEVMGKMLGDKYPEDKRLVFDMITEQFDEWRGRYSEELFEYIRTTCELKAGKKCLEIGPGTGQASDFAIQSGCDYTAIELGENLAEAMQKKYGSYKNFKMVHDDFETHLFAPDYFDLVYSAATIQWIKEDLAYRKCYEILKNKGYLAMFRMLDNDQSGDGPQADSSRTSADALECADQILLQVVHIGVHAALQQSCGILALVRCDIVAGSDHALVVVVQVPDAECGASQSRNSTNSAAALRIGHFLFVHDVVVRGHLHLVFHNNTPLKKQ